MILGSWENAEKSFNRKGAVKEACDSKLPPTAPTRKIETFVTLSITVKPNISLEKLLETMLLTLLLT